MVFFIVAGNINVFVNCKTKLNNSFSSAQFLICVFWLGLDWTKMMKVGYNFVIALKTHCIQQLTKLPFLKKKQKRNKNKKKQKLRNP